MWENLLFVFFVSLAVPLDTLQLGFVRIERGFQSFVAQSLWGWFGFVFFFFPLKVTEIVYFPYFFTVGQ